MPSLSRAQGHGCWGPAVPGTRRAGDPPCGASEVRGRARNAPTAAPILKYSSTIKKIRIETRISPTQTSFPSYYLEENYDFCKFSSTIGMFFSYCAGNSLEQSIAAALQCDKLALVFRSSINFVPE